MHKVQSGPANPGSLAQRFVHLQALLSSPPPQGLAPAVHSYLEGPAGGPSSPLRSWHIPLLCFLTVLITGKAQVCLRSVSPQECRDFVWFTTWANIRRTNASYNVSSKQLLRPSWEPSSQSSTGEALTHPANDKPVPSLQVRTARNKGGQEGRWA